MGFSVGDGLRAVPWGTSRTLTGPDVLYSSLWDWKWHLIKALPGGQGGCRTSPSPAVLPVCSPEHLLPGLPLMPPMAGRGGRSPPEPPRQFFALPGCGRAVRGWNLAEGKHTDHPYLDGERTRTGMPPGPVKHPEPQSCAPLEEVTGVEPAFPGWEPGVLTDGRYLRVGAAAPKIIPRQRDRSPQTNRSAPAGRRPPRTSA